MSSNTPAVTCDTIWLIIILCYSGLQSQAGQLAANIAGLNQEHAQALTTPGLLTTAEMLAMQTKLEAAEATLKTVNAALVQMANAIRDKAKRLYPVPTA